MRSDLRVLLRRCPYLTWKNWVKKPIRYVPKVYNRVFLISLVKSSGFPQASGAVLPGHSQRADTLTPLPLHQKSFLYKVTFRIQLEAAVSAEGRLVVWLGLFWGLLSAAAFVKTGSGSEPQKNNHLIWTSFLNMERPIGRWMERTWWLW